MLITHKIKMDLELRGATQIVNVVQDDKYSRNLEIALFSGNVSWTPPAGTEVVVRYAKPDGKGGNYNILPDGSAAGSISGNVVTVALAPQVCTIPGVVLLTVGLLSGKKEINTFAIEINVHRNPGINVESDDYTRLQTVPLFANSIKDCTDTGKLYVLPDGYIYAYMENANVPQFTNQLKNAVDTDGTKYNGGIGYKTGWRFNSSKQEVEAEGQLITGYIPYTPGQVIRIAGYTNSATPVGYFQACSGFGTSGVINHIQTQQLYGSYEGVSYEPDPAVPGAYMLTIDPKTLSEQYLAQALNGNSISYIRVNLSGYNLAALKATLDEEIVYATTSGWTNTGHAFVPADYEGRIIELEEATEANAAELETQKQQLAALGSGGSVIPNYVISEAESVIDRAIAVQGSRTFTFAALADMHYGAWSYSAGVTHACQAVKYISERIGLDAIAVLGDYTDGSPNSGYSDAIADFKSVNTELDDLQSVPNLRLPGNHDMYSENPALTMRYINAYSDDVVWGNCENGYYYRDFDGYKLRVIGLNTNMRSTEQYQWFASALDLSDKADVKDWSILVLSHHPLDFINWDSDNPNEYDCFGHIVDDYRKGESNTVNGTFGGVVSSVTYDFTNGKNAAKLIGNIHGHIHNFKVDKVHVGWIYEDTSKNVKSDVLRMATPNICYNRENEYGGVWAEDTKYSKTKDSAKDTSFCVYCIDLDECTIKAICYGAGYDREVSYAYTNSAEPPAKKTMSSETWTFEMEDGSTVTRQVVVMV